MEEFLSRVFAARDVAHREHLATDSFAAHQALGEFYADVVGAADAVAEVYQGLFGKIAGYDVRTESVEHIADYLREEADWIETERDILSGGSNAVANLIDGVTAIYLRTVYKLENLQ